MWQNDAHLQFPNAFRHSGSNFADYSDNRQEQKSKINLPVKNITFRNMGCLFFKSFLMWRMHLIDSCWSKYFAKHTAGLSVFSSHKSGSRQIQEHIDVNPLSSTNQFWECQLANSACSSEMTFWCPHPRCCWVTPAAVQLLLCVSVLWASICNVPSVCASVQQVGENNTEWEIWADEFGHEGF